MKKTRLVALGLGALSLAGLVGAGVGLSVNNDVRADEVKAYGANETCWYIDGTFNGWDKDAANYHLSYDRMEGNNWQYATDYPVYIPSGSMFKICYAYNGDAGFDEFVPNLQTNQTDFKIDDGIVANRDIVVNFYFQVYGDNASWTGLYWAEVTPENEALSYADYFLEFIGCDPTGANDPSGWAKIAGRWDEISPAAKTIIKGTEPDIGGSELQRCAYWYGHALRSHPDSISDFMEINSSGVYKVNVKESNNSTGVIITVLSTVGVTAVGGTLLLIRRRKSL